MLSKLKSERKILMRNRYNTIYSEMGGGMTLCSYIYRNVHIPMCIIINRLGHNIYTGGKIKIFLEKVVSRQKKSGRHNI
jgi:hypothetical protein